MQRTRKARALKSEKGDSGGQKLGHFVGVNGTTDVVGLWNSARQCMPATKAKLG